MLRISKESLEHVEIRFKFKKYDFFEKKINLTNFFRFFFAFGVAMVKILFFFNFKLF